MSLWQASSHPQRGVLLFREHFTPHSANTKKGGGMGGHDSWRRSTSTAIPMLALINHDVTVQYGHEWQIAFNPVVFR